MIVMREDSPDKKRVFLPNITCGPDPTNNSICFFNNWKKKDKNFDNMARKNLHVDRSFSYEKTAFFALDGNEINGINDKHKNSSAIFEPKEVNEDANRSKSPVLSYNRKKMSIKDHYRRKIIKNSHLITENSADIMNRNELCVTVNKPEWKHIGERFKNNILATEIISSSRVINESSRLLFAEKFNNRTPPPSLADDEIEAGKKSSKNMKYVPILEDRKIIKAKMILSNLKSSSTNTSPRKEKSSSTTVTPRVDTHNKPKDPLEKWKNLKSKILLSETSNFLDDFDTIELKSQIDSNSLLFLRSVYESRPPTLYVPYPKYIKIQRNERAIIKPNNPNFIVKFGTDYDYKVIPECFKNAGLTQTFSSDWNIFWGKLPPPDVIDRMKWYQKINHYPGSRNLGRKDSLWRNYNRLRQRYPDVYNFMPNTYIMDTDFEMFLYKQKNCNPEDLWILKPVASSCGNGISIVEKSTRIAKKANYLISEYISNPHLINGLKYDLRIYALVSSVDPLRIYMYNEGLVRFATSAYSKEVKNLAQRNRHLTNYAINKFAPEYQHNSLVNEESSSKWSLKMLKKKYEELDINYEYIMDRIKDIIIKTVIAAEPFILQGSMRSHSIDKKCFELYGFDILLDENLKPWLMEVNSSPSLNTDSKFDELVKTKLVCDVINLVGVKIPGCETDLEKDEEMHTVKHFRRNIKQILELNQDNVHEKLSPMDWQILFESEEELHRTGSFEFIFPQQGNIDSYKNLFEIQRYNNLLLWKFKSFTKNILENVAKFNSK